MLQLESIQNLKLSNITYKLKTVNFVINS